MLNYLEPLSLSVACNDRQKKKKIKSLTVFVITGIYANKFVNLCRYCDMLSLLSVGLTQRALSLHRQQHIQPVALAAAESSKNKNKLPSNVTRTHLLVCQHAQLLEKK